MNSKKKLKFVTEEFLDKKLKATAVEIVEGVLIGITEILKGYAEKKDIECLEQKVDHIQGDVTDIKRRVIDLERDTPTQKEFNDLKVKVDRYFPAP